MPRNPWDDDIDILSAENVSFHIETAGLGSRFGAAVIDLLLQFFTLGLGAIAANYLIDYLPQLNSSAQWVKVTLGAIGAIVVALISLGYSFFFEWLWDGQTPGKRWLGLRVMRTNGMPIGVWEAMIRSLMRAVDFLPVMYGVGALVALVNGNNRRVGDMVAGTVVARERHDATRAILDIDSAADAFLASLQAPVGPPAPNSTVLPLDHSATTGASAHVMEPMTHPNPVLAPMNETDRDLLREYFTRRGALKPAAREKLAQSLALRLSSSLRRPIEGEPDAWLGTLAREAFGESQEAMR
jgi:uncharacterized RDD family membrane protein YckC